MKCRCGRPAVFFRKYEGRALCKWHFCQSIEQKVKKTIGKSKMLKRGDRVALALSGGFDSSLLTLLMHKIFSKRRDIEFFAISIDEGIKGCRKPNLQRAAKLCKKFGLKHYIFSFENEFNKTMDQRIREIRREKPKIKEPCTYCGVARRYLLNKFSRKLKATKLCTGHNLDDESESIIMNYIRGDLFRAARVGPITDWSLRKNFGTLFVPRIKPLREVPKDEIRLYAKLVKLDIYKKVCPYRSGIRFDVRAFLEKLAKTYSGIQFTILETFDKIVPALRKIVTKKEGKIKLCKKCKEPGSEEVCKACQLWR